MSKTTNLRICNLQITNFKKIEELTIDRPNFGDIFLIGDNDLGKTSVLQAIFCALKRQPMPKNPITTGKDSGRIVVKIGNDTKQYEVRLSFTEKNPDGIISVTNTEGDKLSEPVAKLNTLLGNPITDLFELANMKPEEQIKWVKEMFGINTSELEKQYKDIYDERTLLNRQVKSLEGAFNESDWTESKLEFYKEQIDTEKLQEQINKANAHNIKVATGKQKTDGYNNEIKVLSERNKNIDDEITKLMLEKEQNDGRIGELKESIAKGNEWIAKNKKQDITDLQEKLQEALRHNQLHNEALQWIKQVVELKNTKDKSLEYTNQLKEIDGKIKAAASESKLPKGFELKLPNAETKEVGIYFNGLPFNENQLSTSLIIEAMVTLQRATNENGLGVICIPRYESVGSKRRKEIEDYAKANNLQVVAEIVDSDIQELHITEVV